MHCLHCFFDSAGSSTHLAQALHRLDQVSLLVDMRGRLFAGSPARSLFDCKQQLERGVLVTLPQVYGDGWYAPGVRADDPNLRSTAQGYDWVVFDAGPIRTGLVLMPGARQTVVLEIQPAQESMLRAYALLKSLSDVADLPDIAMLGDPASCDHVWAACSHFLVPGFAQTLYSVAHEEDAIAALAIRIAGKVGEEQNLTAQTIMGMNLNHGR